MTVIGGDTVPFQRMVLAGSPVEFQECWIPWTVQGKRKACSKHALRRARATRRIILQLAGGSEFARSLVNTVHQQCFQRHRAIIVR